MILAPRRGAALLIVLIAVALLTSAAGLLAQRAASASIERRASDRAHLARDLARASTPILAQWLVTDAASIVLEPGARNCVPVHNASWEDAGERWSLQIHAFDQDGMPSAAALLAGSPVRTLVPTHHLEWVDALEAGSGPLGLDRVAAASELVFPAASEDRADGLALGEHVALLGSGLGSIHVHTAPVDLLTWAFAARGIGGLDVLLEARAKGARLELALPGPDADRLLPGLSNASTSWAFRVDVTVGNCHRSWWSVYQHTGAAWECRQRLAVPHN